MPTLLETCAIAVIAKAPRPGHVKTRLQSILLPEEAARLGAAFLQDTLANILAAATHTPIAPFVAYAPAGQEHRFEGLLPPGAELILADGTNGDAPGVQGFGRVLLDTTRALFARGYGAVCVLGADSPTLPTTLLVRTAHTLLTQRADAVLGPADDGGYWLLGLTHPHPEPYAHIAWSTETVAAETRAHIQAAGLRLLELTPWYDVDDPPSLTRLVHELDPAHPHPDPQPYPASHTSAVLTAIALPERLRRHADGLPPA